jgi:hypothetical protein
MSHVTRENYPEFKKLYEKARDTNAESFWFKGQEILTQYAKYLCEYVDHYHAKEVLYE